MRDPDVDDPAEPCPDAQPTETEIIRVCCFTVTKFMEMCYAATDNKHSYQIPWTCWDSIYNSHQRTGGESMVPFSSNVCEDVSSR